MVSKANAAYKTLSLVYLFYSDGAVTVVGRTEFLHQHGSKPRVKEVKSKLEEIPATHMCWAGNLSVPEGNEL